MPKPRPSRGNRPRFLAPLLFTVLVCGWFLLPADATAAPPEVVAKFDAANTAFETGVARLDEDAEGARAAFEVAIEFWESLVEEDGIRNGYLYYNMGNAYLLSNDVGRAICSYRKAAEFIPSDANLQANLSAARSQVATRIDVRASSRALETLFFWHYDLSPSVRWGAFVVLFAIAWGWAWLRLVPTCRSWPRWPGMLVGVLSLAMLTSLVAEAYVDETRREGVIVANEVVGRKGPDVAGYEPSFTEPLSAGVEYDVMEDRPGWWLIRLHDGRTTWIPQDAGALI